MRVFGVVGPTDERRTAVDRVVDRLSGPVGVVRSDPPDGRGIDPPAGAAITYDDRGDTWESSRDDDATLSDVLDDLAPRCAYAVVSGRPEADLPQIVLGDREVAGDVLVRERSAATIDVDSVVSAVEELEPRETLQSLVREVKRSPDEIYAGAIATFTGRVRAKDDPEDDYTEQLEFERYDDVVAERMDEIESTLEARDGVYEVSLHHRTGVMEAGEDIVFVVVLAGHREEAFETVEDGINRLKEVVPLFKKEVTVEDEFWAHEES